MKKLLLLATLFILLISASCGKARDLSGVKELLIEYEGRDGIFEISELINENINAHNEYYEHTALMIATRYGYWEIVQALIDAGADVDIQNNVGDTVLMLTVVQSDRSLFVTEAKEKINLIKKSQAIQVLIDAGVDVDIQNDDGYTALIVASQFEYIEITQMLIDFGADVDIQKVGGFTPLMIPSQFGDVEITQVLIDAGADVDIQNDDGVTPLIFAAANNHPNIVKILIKAGADINKKVDGYTALMIASESGYIEIVSMLKRAGDH